MYIMYIISCMLEDILFEHLLLAKVTTTIGMFSIIVDVIIELKNIQARIQGRCSGCRCTSQDGLRVQSNPKTNRECSAPLTQKLVKISKGSIILYYIKDQTPKDSIHQ